MSFGVAAARYGYSSLDGSAGFNGGKFMAE